MEIEKSLEGLEPTIRSRVESALKATLEAELAKANVGINENPAAIFENPAAAFSRSKGWVFSRSKTSDVLRDPPELIQNLNKMDEVAFRNFAERLTTLKRLKDEKSSLEAGAARHERN
jgi:hypothetical protein